MQIMTYQEFSHRCEQFYEKKFDFSLIDKYDLTSHSSRVLVTCRRCESTFDQTISEILNCKTKCSSCDMFNRKWTYQRFMFEARRIHGDKYEYMIPPGFNFSCTAQISTKCCHCSNRWRVSVQNHITSRTGCPKCSVAMRNLNRKRKLHGPFDMMRIESILN